MNDPMDAAYLASYLHTIDGPIVLVGHSYGGAVTTNAANGNPNVKALVYVDAFIPDRDQSVLDLVGENPGSHLADTQHVFNFVPYSGAQNGDVDLYVKPAIFQDAFAASLPRREARTLAAEQRPVTLAALGEKSGPPAWSAIRSWSVVGTADNVIPAKTQLAMAHTAGSHVTQIDAPHLSMLAKPQAVTKAIEHAADSTR